MSTFRLAVEKALTGVGPFPRPTSEAILEIAYLTMAVDEELRDEEIDAFSVIAAAVLNNASNQRLDDAALRKWLERFSGDFDRDAIHGRLETAVKQLGADHDAKLAAYRVACLMALSDMDAADREFEFDLDLIASLGISQDEADRVLEEVNQAVAPPEN
ncbi:MAG: hypothetical protein JNK04_06635 [Myxococcales bacterium]|nr:hypothetical protein [Myxococcales bacterium]